jgi:hypothetical protein
VLVQERKARETGIINAVFTAPPPPQEEKKMRRITGEKTDPLLPAREALPAREEKKKRQPPNCSKGQVQAAAEPMGLPKTLTSQFIFFQQDNSLFKQDRSIMIVTIPSLIAAGIATAVVTGGITGTAVYLTSGNAGDQFKTEGGLHILELGHMEPWVIAMMCATVLIGMGTCGTCCHKGGKSYVTDKEAKLRDRALGRAKELVHMGAHGADKLLKAVQTYHDMRHEIVTQKMHQIMVRGQALQEPSMIRVP